MENNFTQVSLVLNANSYKGKDEKEKYNYIVSARVWDGNKFIPELVTIRSEIKHNVGETIYIKSNKSKLGNFYFTETDELPFDTI